MALAKVVAFKESRARNWSYVHEGCFEGLQPAPEISRHAEIYLHPKLRCIVCNEFIAPGEGLPWLRNGATLNEFGEFIPQRDESVVD